MARNSERAGADFGLHHLISFSLERCAGRDRREFTHASANERPAGQPEPYSARRDRTSLHLMTFQAELRLPGFCRAKAARAGGHTLT